MVTNYSSLCREHFRQGCQVCRVYVGQIILLGFFFFRALKHTGCSEGLNWCNRSLGDGVKAGWRTHVSAAEGTQAKPSGAQSETADRCGDKLVSY